MVPSNQEGYACLQVERRIIDRPTEFLGKVGHIARKVFGEEPVTALPETSVYAEEHEDGSIELDEPVTRLVTVHEPVAPVYRADDLRLVLLRMSVPLEMSGKYNFNRKAYVFNANQNYILKGKGKPNRKLPPIRETLDKISTDHDVRPTNTPILFDRIQDIGDLAGEKELALLPSVGQPASTVVHEQSAACSEWLTDISPSAMNPQSLQIPFVPFMRLPRDVSDGQFKQFMDELNGQPHLLPVRLVMDSMKARSGKRMV